MSTPEDRWQNAWAKADAERERLREERDKLQEFKEYVHHRLDLMGVPADPESPHKAEGCRVGGRLDWIADRLPGEQQGRGEG